ncbi:MULTISPECIES: HNH endonuclease [Hyphomicrobiales]|uniref:HNH endonuclease n=1 Tax=Hyphomicrobiales TaxID=356 RepID=UPI002B1D190E|nr:HNH endonuclease [Kaistia defluvii]
MRGLTGISDPALLRASHIVPWSACESDAERRCGMLPSTVRSSHLTTRAGPSSRPASASKRVPNCAGIPPFR